MRLVAPDICVWSHTRVLLLQPELAVLLVVERCCCALLRGEGAGCVRRRPRGMMVLLCDVCTTVTTLQYSPVLLSRMMTGPLGRMGNAGVTGLIGT